MKSNLYSALILLALVLLVCEKTYTQPLSGSITSSTNVTCNGGNNGSATATGVGGNPPYTYFWSNWETTPTINNLWAGNYDVTITDEDFSEAFASVFITEPPFLFLNESITNVSCYGGNNGSISTQPTGGVPPFLFNWSNGSTSTMISNLTAGSYSLTVTEGNACTKTATFIVTQPVDLDIDLFDLNDEICAGAGDGSITISVFGGINPITAEWSNGDTGLTISDLAPGTYSVTATDDNGCFETATYTINAGSILNVTLLQIQDVSCFGGSNGAISVSASGNMPPFNYLWSNGGSGPSISGLMEGTYMVTATDLNGCEVIENYTVNEPTALSLSITQSSQNLCFGDANVDLTANAIGGTPAYAAIWSNGATGLYNNDLAAGTYTVTVTDANSCVKTATTIVTQPADLVIDLVDLNHETCAGLEDGSITIELMGGVIPIDVEWSNGLTDLFISDLAAGFYSVTATDENGCTETSSYSINPGITVNVTLLQLQNVSCNGGSNGAISLSASGGNFPYTYVWSNGMTGPSISGLTPGTYLVTVTEGDGCAVVNNYTINEPAAISISITQTSQNLCFGDTIADLSAGISGGTPGYTALWSDGAVGLNNNNLAAGIYSVTVTDANSCTSLMSATITDPTQLNVTVSATDETAFGANDGTATATAGGGTPVYSYLWSNGGTTPVITGLAPGLYTVTLTDTNGCTTTGSGLVNPFGCTIGLFIQAEMITICEGDTSTLQAVVTGASGVVTYLWSNGSTNSSMEASTPGIYCVTISDAAGCQDVECIDIFQIPFPDFICPVVDESSAGANDGAILCDSLPGFVSYLWSNGSTTASISGLAPGEYCVTVTDANGCTGTQCFNVQPANCQMSITSTQTNVSCNSDSTGSISLIVTGATEPVTYTWSNGTTSATIINLVSGNYEVTVDDAAGCIDNQSFIITEPPPITITVDSIASVDDSNSGLIWITVNGGTPSYIYQWLDPVGGTQNTEDLNNLTESGYYYLIVTDAAGCMELLDSIFVDENVAVDHSPQLKSLKVYPVPTDDVLFIDMENPITEVVISGADGRIYKRMINPGFNKIDVSSLEAGWYAIRISDGHGWYMARMVK